MKARHGYKNKTKKLYDVLAEKSSPGEMGKKTN